MSNTFLEAFQKLQTSWQWLYNCGKIL